MSLFEVQRLSKGWSSLHGSAIARNLFSEVELIKGVWLFQNHVFVAWQSEENNKLYIFNQVPLNIVEDYTLLNLNSRVVEILFVQQNIVLLVEERCNVQVLAYDDESFHWKSFCSSILDVGDGVIVNGVSKTLDKNNQLLCCIQSASCLDEWSNSIYALSYCIDFQNKLLEFSEYNQVLFNSPIINMYPVKSGGIWLIPRTGHLTPLNLIVFWSNKNYCVKPFIWGKQTYGSYIGDKQWKDFKVLSRRTSYLWRKEASLPSLVAFTVHPVSQDLLSLTENGSIFKIPAPESGHPKVLVKLVDFTKRYPSPKLWYSSSVPASLEIFFLNTYVGICHNGELRVYDSFTGEFIWECDDLDHPTTRLVPHQSPLAPVSLWNKSGMYLVCCKKIADHAQMFVESLFPIATNADETTPGDVLENGEIVAASLCHLWSLNMIGSQYSLKLAYRLLKESDVVSNPALISQVCIAFQNGVSFTLLHAVGPYLCQNNNYNLQEGWNNVCQLLMLLEHLSIRNPSVCVALLSQYPMYRYFLNNQLSKFLDIHYNSDEVHSSLDDQTAPLLKKYLELSVEYEKLLSTLIMQEPHIPTVRERVVEIIKSSQQSTLSHDPTVHLRAELTFLSMTEPLNTLLGIKDFMKVPTTFAQKTMQSNWVDFGFSWRNILALEVPEKLPEKSIKATSQFVNLPIFEVTVQLLYCHEPQDLLAFISFVQKARDLQLTSDSAYTRQCHKGYFYERTLDILSPPTSTASADQVHCYCQVLILSSCAEIKALKLLLDHSLWSSAIDLFHQLHTEISHSVRCAMFHNTLYHMSKEGVLHEYINSMWPLLPENFNIHNFMDVLKQSYKTSDQLQVYVDENSEELQVQHVTPFILQLLS